MPLVATLPQERLRFFVSFGVYGVLGPRVVRDFQAAERLRRYTVRSLWGAHALWLPVMFIPSLFSCAALFSGGAANALDRVVPRAAEAITVVLNAPTPRVPWYQSQMRAANDGIPPAVYTLYAGGQSLQATRVAERGLELYAAHSWVGTPLERIRDFQRWPFHSGDRVALEHLSVEVREVDSGVCRPAFASRSIARWMIPAWHSAVGQARSSCSGNRGRIGSRVQLPAVAMF